MPMSAEERKKRKREYYLRYKERVGVKALRAADRERGRRYRIRNRDKIRERARRYRAALEYKMKRAEYMQRAYVKEKEEKRCREKARRYYWEHREEILQHSKLPEVKAKTKARMREYYQRPEVKERRASISMHVKVEKIERKCPICGAPIFVYPSRVKEGRGNYCSVDCYRKAQRKHYKKELDEKEIVRLYNEEKMSATKIAEKYGCYYNSIYAILRKHTKIRNPHEAHKSSGFVERRKDIDTKALIDGYESGLSGTELAKKYKCTKEVVYQRLKRYGHPRRTDSEALKLFMKTERGSDYKVKMRERVKAQQAKPEWRDFHRRKILRQYEAGVFPRQSNTNIERLVKEELLKRGYKEGRDFLHQFKFYDKFMCDFVFPKQRVVVECDGDFWHANPSKYAGKPLKQAQKRTLGMDKSKDAYIKKVDDGSWTLVHLWESDIKKEVKACVDKIEKVLS